MLLSIILRATTCTMQQVFRWFQEAQDMFRQAQVVKQKQIDEDSATKWDFKKFEAPRSFRPGTCTQIFWIIVCLLWCNLFYIFLVCACVLVVALTHLFMFTCWLCIARSHLYAFRREIADN